jgi:hypothetical protein
MAVSKKARRSRVDYPPLRIARFSGPSLDYGVTTKKVEGVAVRVFNPAKTVSDCFKYRNKIGLDVALETLRDCDRRRKATIDELWKAAKVCRVARVMQPYLPWNVCSIVSVFPSIAIPLSSKARFSCRTNRGTKKNTTMSAFC